jgi:ABC-type sugar transport system permease subunit
MDIGKVTPLRREGAERAQLRRKIRWRDASVPYLFISPFVISFLVLFVGPVVYSFVLSFFRYKGYGPAKFTGIANYETILQYHVFWTVLGNTFFYWLFHVIPMLAIAFLLAVLVRSKLVKWQSFYKPVIFLPNVVSAVVAALLFQSLFGTKYGVINSLLGIEVPWLQDQTLVKYVVVFILIWGGVGWWFIIFLAGLTSINPDLEEAALIDGASIWQRLRYVILPLMRGTFLFAFVIDGIYSLRLFTEPNVLVSLQGSLAPDYMAPLLNLLIGNLRSGRFGSASAVGWILFVLTVIISFFQFHILRDASEEVE